MAFFVEVKDSKSKNDIQPEHIDLELLAIGKRTGLTFAEINEMSISDLLSYVSIYTGSEDGSSRKATQEDIDAFFS